MIIQSFVVSPFASNCYILAEADSPGARAVVIDPGDLALEPVISWLTERRLSVEAIWCTHAHLDHVMGVDVLRRHFPVPAIIHPADRPLWDTVHLTVRQWLGRDMAPLAPPDATWDEGDEVQLGSLRFRIWHTPGHSPGSVCLVGDEIAFTGDTVFAGSIGRTDLPGSDPAAMQRSLKRVLDWPDELILYPGHMGKTVMKHERQWNPFLQDLAEHA
ncbi:MAG: MBL fold metallo-hydrolase [Thermoflavifilum sp.]|nr:MBL fold metallo-hydrolase [Thermoflavifilum sp.]MCL6512849.1 MBL fold metallo-hydrolase [Alicyclobacillus sp.]